jgi:nicotinate-nucleotide adenylyltransferase
MVKKIGIMGGTFDPVHIAHLITAETALVQGRLDEIWFIPVNVPPLKLSGIPEASPVQRMEMLQSAIADVPGYKALDIELRRSGTSYSIDTMLELHEQYPDYHFSYIIGADRIIDLPKWHRIRELAELVNFIGVMRPGSILGNTGMLPPTLRKNLDILQMPLLDISSTGIRNRLADGRSIRWIVPESVHQYIRENHLYGA